MIILAFFIISWASGVQPKPSGEITLLQTVLGNHITIKCFLATTDATTVVWYKQGIGQIPKLIAFSYNYMEEVKIVDEFNNGRFTVSTRENTFHLNITATTKEDVGMYFCGTAFLNQVEFISGAFLVLQANETKDLHVEQQPVLIPVHQGDDVKFQCKILSESCAGDHSVYWFRRGSGESHPGILYTQTHDQCNRNSEAGSKAHKCVYNFSKRNVSLSDAGIYYCAVAACGEILFGNGTTVEIADINNNQNVWNLLLVFLISSNVVFVIVIILLLVHLFKNRRNTHRGFTKSASPSGEIGDVLNYAAVSLVSVPSSSKRAANRDLSEYSEVICKPKHHMS